MNTTEVAFPAISVKDATIELHKSVESLTHCTKAALRKGWYQGMKILDSAGFLRSVRGATLVRQTNERAYPGIFAPRLVEVALDLSEEKLAGLDEVRAFVKRAVLTSRSSWESAGFETSTIVREVEGAGSISAIWKVLMPLL